MEKVLFVSIHLILPLILTIDLVIRKSKSKLGLIIRTLLYMAIISFLFLWGQWPFVGSYYLRYILVVILIAMLLLSMKRIKSLKSLLPVGILGKILTFFLAILMVTVVIMNVSALNGRIYPTHGQELEFPLRNGMFYVASGGSSKIINNHMRNYPNAQEFALDINKLGAFGNVSKKFLSDNITDHYIYSDTIYCPCNGIILEIKNNIKDNLFGSMKVSSKDGTGNFLNIYCESDFFVFIPHLKENSLLVSEDMNVKIGTPLGLIGNSGFSQEPHLHIQAAKYNLDSILVGIPIIFNDRKLSRNDLFKN